MNQDKKRNVTVCCDRIRVSSPRCLVSRPRRGSCLQEEECLETLLFTDSGVHVINLNENALGPALLVWRRDEDFGPDGQLYELPFTWDFNGSAVWDPWTERVIFSCGSSEVLALNEANEVIVVVDFAQAAGTAPRDCDFLALDPQHRGRLWVATAAAGGGGGGPLGSSGGGEVYEVDLRSILAAPEPPSARPVTPLVRRIAAFQEPLNGTVFDASRRCLLLATSCAIYGLPVDPWQWPGGAGAGDGAGELEPEALIDADGPLNGVTGMACGAAADGGIFIVESVRVQHVRSRAGVARSTVRRLTLGNTAARGAAAGGLGQAGGGGAGGSGAGGGSVSGGPTLTMLATTDGTEWTGPQVLPDGRLAILDAGDAGEVLLLALHPTPPPAQWQPSPGVAGVADTAAITGGLPLPRRTLAADLGALLDSCQDPGGGGGGADVTLVAAGGLELRAHAGVLMARCDYFRPLLGGAFGDSGSRRVQLPDVDAGVLRCVLRHIYTGAADLQPLLQAPHWPPPPPQARPPAAATAAAVQSQQPRAQQQQGLVQEAVGPRSSAAGGDPLLSLAEAADRLLLPELSRAAQACVLRRCQAAAAQHLVADLVWAEARGFGQLLRELKELYVTHAEALEAAERAAEAVPEPRRRGRSHQGLVPDSGGGGGGAGPRQLAGAHPRLAEEVGEEVAARKRRRGGLFGASDG